MPVLLVTVKLLPGAIESRLVFIVLDNEVAVEQLSQPAEVEKVVVERLSVLFFALQEGTQMLLELINRCVYSYDPAPCNQLFLDSLDLRHTNLLLAIPQALHEFRAEVRLCNPHIQVTFGLLYLLVELILTPLGFSLCFDTVCFC